MKLDLLAAKELSKSKMMLDKCELKQKEIKNKL